MFPGEVLNSNCGQAKPCLSSSGTKAAGFGLQRARGLKLCAGNELNSCLCKPADWAELLHSALQEDSEPRGTMMGVRSLRDVWGKSPSSREGEGGA